MSTIFGWLFSGLWAWILGKLSISPEQKLGQASAQAKEQSSVIASEGKANEVENANSAINDDDIAARLCSEYGRK